MLVVPSVFVIVIITWGIYASWRTFSSANEWTALAKEYRTNYEKGLSVKCYISLRFPPWRSPLQQFGEFPDGLLTVTSSGLQISRWLIKVPWRPPLLVPWSDIGLIGHRGLYEFDGNAIYLTFAKVPAIRMRIPENAVESLLKAGAPWYLAADGNLRARELSASNEVA